MDSNKAAGYQSASQRGIKGYSKRQAESTGHQSSYLTTGSATAASSSANVDLLDLDGPQHVDLSTPPRSTSGQRRSRSSAGRKLGQVGSSQASLATQELLDITRVAEQQASKAQRTSEATLMDTDARDDDLDTPGKSATPARSNEGDGSMPATSVYGSEDGLPEGLEHDTGDGTVSKDQLDKLLSDFENRISLKIDRSNADIKASIAQETRVLFEQYDKGYRTHLAVIDTKILGLDTKFAQIMAKWDAYDDRLSAVERKLGLLASAPDAAALKVEEGFYRSPNPTTLKFNCRQLVAKQAVAKVVEDWMGSVHMEGAGKVVGPNTLARSWTLQFEGTIPYASEQANKFLRSLRNGGENGKWKEFWVQTPTGSQLQLFCGPDQNGATRATISIGKSLLTCLEEKLPAAQYEKFHYLKYEGILTYDWLHIASVKAMPHFKYEVQWDDAVVSDTIGTRNRQRVDTLLATKQEAVAARARRSRG